MYCHKCGKALDMGMEFCPFCGAKVTRRDVQVEVPIPTEEVAEEHTMKQEVVEETKQTLAKKRIEEMFTLCGREEEFLMLRQKILQMEVEEEEKATLLMALDDATRVRLDPIIELAEDYEEIRDFPVGNVIGCTVLAGIGLVINYFFSMKWPGIICCILAVLSIAGTMMDRVDRKKVAREREAAEWIERYRKQGYKI